MHYNNSNDTSIVAQYESGEMELNYMHIAILHVCVCACVHACVYMHVCVHRMYG